MDLFVVKNKTCDFFCSMPHFWRFIDSFSSGTLRLTARRRGTLPNPDTTLWPETTLNCLWWKMRWWRYVTWWWWWWWCDISVTVCHVTCRSDWSSGAGWQEAVVEGAKWVGRFRICAKQHPGDQQGSGHDGPRGAHLQPHHTGDTHTHTRRLFSFCLHASSSLSFHLFVLPRHRIIVCVHLFILKLMMPKKEFELFKVNECLCSVCFDFLH